MCHVLAGALGPGRPRLHRVVRLSYRAAVGRSPSGLDVGPISSYVRRRPPPDAVSPADVYSIADEPTALHLHALFALAERQVSRALFNSIREW